MDGDGGRVGMSGPPRTWRGYVRLYVDTLLSLRNDLLSTLSLTLYINSCGEGERGRVEVDNNNKTVVN